MSPTDDDRRHLDRARRLARKGWGRVHPNPMVGCVLVRDGVVVGEGWHREYGEDHAEVEALRAAGDAARGSTVYVTLEPCNHWGKTPPCTRALQEAGVKRVVFGVRDPHPRAGGGEGALREAGVEVEGPLLVPEEARRDDPHFFHRAKRAREPYVALKLAVSLDGRVAEKPGHRTEVTGPEAAEETHRLRAGFDGVMVGGVTARVDDPLLTVRGSTEPRVPPARVVLDPGARLPPTARLFQDVARSPVMVVHAPGADSGGMEALRAAGARLLEAPSSREGLDLPAALRALRAEGLETLFCEGGGRLAHGLINAGLVHRIHLFVAPRAFGDEGVPAFPGTPEPGAWEGWEPLGSPRVLGRDVHIVLERSG